MPVRVAKDVPLRRRCLEYARAYKDLEGTVHLLWHCFVAPLWDRMRELEETPLAQNSPTQLREAMRKHVEAVLRNCGGKKMRAARALGITDTTIRHILKRKSEPRKEQL